MFKKKNFKELGISVTVWMSIIEYIELYLPSFNIKVPENIRFKKIDPYLKNNILSRSPDFFIERIVKRIEKL